jgi:hypothetical protein
MADGPACAFLMLARRLNARRRRKGAGGDEGEPRHRQPSLPRELDDRSGLVPDRYGDWELEGRLAVFELDSISGVIDCSRTGMVKT